MKRVFCLVIGAYCLLVFASASFSFEIPAFMGDEVLVTATRRLELKSTSPWTSSVISQKEIGRSGKTMLADVLRGVPGVDVLNYGYLGAISSIKLRGSSTQQVLVLINGQRINSPLFGGVTLTSLTLDNVERIEVVRTPLSVIYGSDAIGGAVNVITKQPSAGSKLELVTATYNTQKISWAQNCRLDNTAYSYSLNYLTTDGFRSNSGFASLGGDLSMAWESASGSKITVGQIYSNSHKLVPGSLTFPSPLATQQDLRSLTSVSFDLAPGQEAELSGRVYQNFEQNRFEDPNWATWGLASVYEHLTFVKGAEIQGGRSTDEGGYLAGLDIRREEAQSASISGYRSVDNLAVYFQQNIWGLEWGLRGDLHSTFGSVITPRVGYKGWLNPAFSVSATYAGAFRAPNLNELYGNYPPDYAGGPAWVGNPALHPEKGQLFDLAFDFQHGKDIGLNLAVFSGRTENLITTSWPLDTVNNVHTPVNISSSTRYGGELEFKKAFGDFSTLAFNYTYQKAADDSTSEQLVYVPENKANLSVLFGSPDLWGNLVGRYAGERFYQDYNVFPSVRKALPAYFIVDLFAAKKVGAAEVKAGIENLTDMLYQEIADYPQPGRRGSVGLKFNLD